MTITAGSRLGPYEILSPLGAGGMGEVWRARDARLGRDVAIKVLPAAFAADADRLARFRREAQVLAALNHPHIAAIHGVEESGATEALVLELVEGETLAERLAGGPLPIEEALEISRQIADGLAAAHERGIVHRDLKPANVKLTPEGKVKILDFGLAKALAGDGSSPDVSRSPTLTAEATQAGIVIGTAAYMSPEQARGKSVDKRADIWAFGAVLYEMLSGRRAFEGETVSDILAGILTRDPDWSALPAATPASVRRVLRRCLDRDAKTRLHDVADARIEMDEAPEPAAAAPAAASRSRRAAPWALAGLLAALAAAGWWLALRPRASESPPRTSFSFLLPGAERVPFDDTPVLELSRSGRELAFLSDSGGRRQVWLRAMDRLEARPIAGTDGAYGPFLSPDGRTVAYFANEKLRKVAVDGGVPVVVCAAPTNRGGVWLTDDTIVFAPEFTSGLFAVPARGGKPEALTTPDAKTGERTHRWPAALPGDEAVLFTIGMLQGPGNYDDARIAVYDRRTRQVRILIENGSMARYVPSGHLIFLRTGVLYAVPFDAKRLEVTGEAAALTQRVDGDPSSGVGYYTVSSTGSLAFLPGAGSSVERELVLFDRSGQSKARPLPRRAYVYPRFSPDGKRVAFSIGPGRGKDDDVWTCDLETGALARLTFGGTNYYPVWSHDGRKIAYSSDRAHQGIFLKASDGSGEEEPLRPEARPELPADFSPDGATLALMKNFPNTDLFLFDFASRQERPFETDASMPSYSPDGRWIAFVARGPGGLPQIVVRPASGSGGRLQITPDSGSSPVWCGREIFFIDGDKVFSVEAETQPTFRSGAPRLLFQGVFDRGTAPLRNYDVTRDGKRFVFVRGQAGAAWKRIDILSNWAEELRSAAPASRK
jgi:serine/threonine-protein kinase